MFSDINHLIYLVVSLPLDLSMGMHFLHSKISLLGISVSNTHLVCDR